MDDAAEVVKLLEEAFLDTEPLLDKVQAYYDKARKSLKNADLNEAERQCSIGLNRLHGSIELYAPVSRGKLYLLLASILLKSGDFQGARENFLLSADQFRSRQLSHLEAIAHFGYAYTNQQINDFTEALTGLDKARSIASRESIPDNVNKAWLTGLQQAINRTYETIPSVTADTKTMRVFYLSDGQQCITTDSGTVDLNLLSLTDYQRHGGIGYDVTIDLYECGEATRAEYILEIDAKVNQVEDGLNIGDWLMIRSVSDPKDLTGKQAAVFIIEPSNLRAGKKVFIQAADHYFLQAHNGGQSVIVISYKVENSAKIIDYYKAYENVKGKYAYQVRISGEVIKHLKYSSIGPVTQGLLWRIPVLESISAGTGVIASDSIIDYLNFETEAEANYANFGVMVDGDSMKDINILDGDIALIERLTDVHKKIAAITLLTPNTSAPISVLKQFFLRYPDSDKLRHVVLRAKNAGEVDWVIMEEGVDKVKIRQMYSKFKMIFYEDAELHVVGACVGLVRFIPGGRQEIYHYDNDKFMLKKTK